MPRLDVCIEPIFNDLSLVERAKRVYDAGFDAIEFWFYDMGGIDRGVSALGKFCAENNILINNAVVNAPDGSIGGSLVDPDDRPRYIARLKETIKVCKDINCHAAITCTGNCRHGVSYYIQKRSVIDTLKAAAEVAEEQDFQLFLEPLNTLVDHPGYFLWSAEEGADIVWQVGSPRVKLLFDIYHMQ
ncbi:MAG: TIM barrel protein, partial [Armatimonadota bacterium]